MKGSEKPDWAQGLDLGKKVVNYNGQDNIVDYTRVDDSILRYTIIEIVYILSKRSTAAEGALRTPRSAGSAGSLAHTVQLPKSSGDTLAGTSGYSYEYLEPVYLNPPK